MIQKKAKDLLVATHGRSLYKRNLKELYQMNTALKESKNLLFEIEDLVYSKQWGSKSYTWGSMVLPQLNIGFYFNTLNNATLTIKNKDNIVVYQHTYNAVKGLKKITFDVTIDEKTKKAIEKADASLKIHKGENNNYYLPVGKYFVELNDGAKTVKQPFEIKSEKLNFYDN